MSRNTYAKLQQRDDDSSSVAALFASHLALAPQDSFELDSLASSTHDHSNGGGSGHSRGTDTPSSRGLSPLRSPIGTDYDVDAQRDHELDSEDYQHLLLGDSRGARTGGMDHRHARTGSVSTLGSLVFSLPTTRDRRAEMEVPLEKQKRLSLFDGLSLVIGLQIGSGIFSSPTQVDLNVGSVGASLIVWLVAGLLAWTGASSYAELGSTIPLNGSSQAYLNHIYGPLPSFLFSWTAVTILKPGSAAIISIIFGEYVGRCMGGAAESYWLRKLFALLGLTAVTAVNAFSTQLGARAGNVFFVLKIVLLVALIVLGIVGAVVLRHRPDAEPSALVSSGGRLFEGSATDIGNYAMALYAGLWAYDGWDNVNYVSAEMKNARRDLPRVIHTALPVVITAYLLANLSYYAVLSRDELLGSSTVTLAMANKVVGRAGGVVFALLIALSCLGALHASVFTYARLIYTSARDGFFPALFARTALSRGTPVPALALGYVLTAGFILVGEFHSLLTFYGLASYLFYFLTVLGVIFLRVREPALDRPYKTFIATPILFCCVALFLVSRTVFEQPLQSLYAVLFIALGAPIYWWRFGVPWHLPAWLTRVFFRR